MCGAVVTWFILGFKHSGNGPLVGFWYLLVGGFGGCSVGFGVSFGFGFSGVCFFFLVSNFIRFILGLVPVGFGLLLVVVFGL